MVPARSTVPDPLSSLDSIEHASGSRQVGWLHKTWRRRHGKIESEKSEKGRSSSTGREKTITFIVVHFPLCFLLITTIFEDDRSDIRLATLMKRASSGLATTFQLSAGLTALPHSSMY